MGLTLLEYYAMSERQFLNYQEAFNKRTARQYEHTRVICYYIAAANRDPKKSFPSLQKFWPLPTDGKTMEVIDKGRADRIKALYEQAKEMING